jgi:hypothetical protein
MQNAGMLKKERLLSLFHSTRQGVALIAAMLVTVQPFYTKLPKHFV